MGDARMSDPKVSAIEAQAERSEATEPLGAQQAVMIFVKRPAPGRVKTRLAAGVGADAVCDFYCACCEHVVTNIARCPDLSAVSSHSQTPFSHPILTPHSHTPCSHPMLTPHAHTPCSHPMLTPFATIILTCNARLPPICHSPFHACINRSPATIHAGGGDWIKSHIPDVDGAIVAAAFPAPRCMSLVSLPAFHAPSMTGGGDWNRHP
ncbi:unnamed protein product [Closterium sp. Naga37s-1]|nr:unnamed protein product [Closterium sp. Naga37s-1]